MATKSILELLNGVTRFGRLTVTGEGEPIRGAGHPNRRARCLCDCGTVCDIQPGKLKRGTHRSCGCLVGETASKLFTKHGLHRTREYKSWNAMRQRCLNPKSTSFAIYGGRGITICPQWVGENGVEQFIVDLGPRPSGMTLDRIDVNGSYEPGNVRWATPKDQSNNRRNNTLLTLNGETRTERQWTDLRGWSPNVINERIRRGWSVERALTEPVLKL